MTKARIHFSNRRLPYLATLLLVSHDPQHRDEVRERKTLRIVCCTPGTRRWALLWSQRTIDIDLFDCNMWVSMVVSILPLTTSLRVHDVPVTCTMECSPPAVRVHLRDSLDVMFFINNLFKDFLCLISCFVNLMRRLNANYLWCWTRCNPV